MTKQEFFAMSLPYEIKAELNQENIELINPSRWGNVSLWDSSDYKPILHPLSDLTKPIEHKGEKFVPRDMLKWNGIYNTHEGINIYLDELCAKDFLKLIEWHFDIAGLIEKGEAIDVNSLKENPYK